MVRMSLIPAALLFMAAPVAAWTPPRRQAEPKKTECPEVGPGYVRVPGTGTCVKLGGSVRVEALHVGGSR